MSTKPQVRKPAPKKAPPPPPPVKKAVKPEPKPAPAKAKAVIETFPTGADLAMAALDINTLLDPENQIDSELPVKDLTELVKEAAEAVVVAEDKLQDDTWKVLAALKVGPRKDEPEAETKPDAAVETTKAAGKPKAEAKTEKPVKAEKKSGGSRPGIITSIEEILKSGKFTLAEIVKKLVAKFPGRPEKGLHHTAYVQVYPTPEGKTDWSTLRTKRGLTIHTNKEEQYWIGSGKSK